MRRANTAAIVAVEIFVETKITGEGGGLVKNWIVAIDGANSVSFGKENIHHALRQEQRNFFQIHHGAAIGWALHFEIWSVVVVVTQQAFKD